MRDIVRDRALSAVEKMADRHAPIGSYLPKSPSTRAVTDLWSRSKSSWRKAAT